MREITPESLARLQIILARLTDAEKEDLINLLKAALNK